MQSPPRARRLGGDTPDASAFDRYADYEDDGDLIVCDRRNPKAWIRSDRTVTLDP